MNAVESFLKAAELEFSQWRPMEDAPRDEHTHIFLWNRRKRCPVTAVYSREHGGWSVVDCNGDMVSVISDDQEFEDDFRWLPIHSREERAVPVSSETWESVNTFVMSTIGESDVPNAFFSVCADGSVHLQWTTNSGVRGSLEFMGRQVTWNVIRPNGNDEIVPCSQDVFDRIRSLYKE